MWMMERDHSVIPIIILRTLDQTFHLCLESSARMFKAPHCLSLESYTLVLKRTIAPPVKVYCIPCFAMHPIAVCYIYE